MRQPREPGFYWVLDPEDGRVVVAEWRPAASEKWPWSCWALPGREPPLEQEEVEACSERLEEPGGRRRE